MDHIRNARLMCFKLLEQRIRSSAGRLSGATWARTKTAVRRPSAEMRVRSSILLKARWSIAGSREWEAVGDRSIVVFDGSGGGTPCQARTDAQGAAGRILVVPPIASLLLVEY